MPSQRTCGGYAEWCVYDTAKREPAFWELTKADAEMSAHKLNKRDLGRYRVLSQRDYDSGREIAEECSRVEPPTSDHVAQAAPNVRAAGVRQMTADEIAMGLLQEVIDKSEPRKPGGQQVGVQRYQMTPSTRQELQRILRHWKDARISAAERPAPTCQWTEDDDGVWHTDCGEAWQFTTDGPIENRQRYCGYCGKSLSAAPRSVVAPEE